MRSQQNKWLRKFAGMLAIVFLGSALFVPQTKVQADTAGAAATAITSGMANVQNNWQKGMSIVSRGPGDFASAEMKQSMQNLAADGADYVTFIINYYQQNIFTTTIYPGPNTPTDQDLVTAITEAHNMGLKVQLTLHDDPPDLWRANIDPQGSARDTWFTNYGNLLAHYAQIAQQNHVEELCMGAEMIKMTNDNYNPTNTQHWVTIIGNLRKIYSGRLTYSAQWPPTDPNSWMVEHIMFWPLLDDLGMTVYPILTADDHDVNSIISAWQLAENSAQVIAFAHKYNKKVIFGEIGYNNYTNCTYNPWEYNPSRGDDELCQADAYQAFFQYWSQFPEIAGVHFWEWEPNPAAGGPGDVNFTPQNKMAENTLKTWFGGTGVPPQSATFPLRINSGGAGYKDAQGNVWNTDSFATGGNSYVNYGLNIANTTNPAVYQSERYGNTFSYVIPNVTNGSYQVTLKFAEIYWTSKGQRVFNVSLNGQPVLSNFDIIADAGAADKADDKTFNVNVTNQTIKIDFTTLVDNAKISGIEIKQNQSNPTPATYIANAITDAQSYNPGSNAKITTYVTSDQSVQNIIVDTELWNSAGKIGQNFSNVALTANKALPIVWNSTAPSVYGPYTIKVGVFAGDWSKVFYWNDNAGALNVGSTVSQSNGTFSSQFTNQNAAVGQNITLPITITGTGDSQNVLVDFEIYDNKGNKVLQKYYGSQWFKANIGQPYNIPWTPAVGGSYTLKFGIFKNDWSSLFFWNDNAGTIQVN